MQLFINKNKSLATLKESPFKLEKEIQTLFESNLSLMTNYKLVKSEFQIKGYRIDTLAYDEESESFVIIEYKRDRNYSVIDQGISYLNLMLEHQADFIIEYNESCNTNLRRDKVDWSQSKVIFIAPTFTDYQKQSTNFKDLSIELWEIKRFKHDILLINPLKKSKAAPSIKKINNNDNEALSKITKELMTYDEDYHLNNKSDDLIALYESFKNAILQLDINIDIFYNKKYISFKQDKRNIADIHLQNKSLKLWINAKLGEIDDPKKLTRDMSKTGHLGNGDYEITVTDTKNIEYIMSLIKQNL